MSMACGGGSDDKDNDLYLDHIQYLEGELERYQLKGDELAKQNEDLASQYSALESHKKNITDSLKHCEAVLEKKVEELLEQLKNQQQVAEQGEESLSLQHFHQKQELQQQIENLKSQNTIQAAKIVEQKEQLIQLMQKLQHGESLEKELAHQKEEHEACIHNQMTETALVTAKVMGNVIEVDDLVEMKISDILQKKRAIYTVHKENIKTLQNKKMLLQEEEDTRIDRYKNLCNQFNNLERDIKLVNKEGITCKKEMKQVSDNWKQLKVMLKQCSITHQHILAEMELLRHQVDLMFAKLCKKADEVNEMVAKIETEKSRQRQLEGLTQEAAIILRYILMESDKPTNIQWKMERLLEILESGARPTSSTPSHSIRKEWRHKPSDFADMADPASQLPLSKAETSTSAEQ